MVLVMVKLEARRIVALGSPSVLALFSAARSSASLLTRYSAADAPRGKSSAMANAMGILGIRVEESEDLEQALRRALAHDGPVLVDVVTATQELAMPPTIKLEQAKGFSLYMLKAVMSGRGDEVIELARTNLFR